MYMCSCIFLINDWSKISLSNIQKSMIKERERERERERNLKGQ